MKKLPIWVSTLREIIEEGHTYVDKTRIVHQLVERGKYYFLSRPHFFRAGSRKKHSTFYALLHPGLANSWFWT
ncbi:AAA family ATPase [Desulfonatronovibrio magnus]|uniref:AAA family ATPase n=1 Tax=Desulfonatronovibrio magnus TaxID=698827 RepID=UPI0005EB7575|nr:AAA family ATPase [Desulfonatronovibrio magnus]